MTNQEYLDLLQTEYFSECKGQSVLEIGPGHGIHSELILAENPANLTAIEPDPHWIPHLQTLKFSEIIMDDAMLYLSRNKQDFDVAVCCGVLYHLHSPLYLLELIVNQCSPNKIILESVSGDSNLYYFDEVDNATGNRFVVNEWRSAKVNLVASFDIINKAMYNMKYTLIKKDTIHNSEWDSKSNNWIASWERRT